MSQEYSATGRTHERGRSPEQGFGGLNQAKASGLVRVCGEPRQHTIQVVDANDQLSDARKANLICLFGLEGADGTTTRIFVELDPAGHFARHFYLENSSAGQAMGGGNDGVVYVRAYTSLEHLIRGLTRGLERATEEWTVLRQIQPAAEELPLAFRHAAPRTFMRGGLQRWDSIHGELRVVLSRIRSKYALRAIKSLSGLEEVAESHRRMSPDPKSRKTARYYRAMTVSRNVSELITRYENGTIPTVGRLAGNLLALRSRMVTEVREIVHLLDFWQNANWIGREVASLKGRNSTLWSNAQGVMSFAADNPALLSKLGYPMLWQASVALREAADNATTATERVADLTRAEDCLKFFLGYQKVVVPLREKVGLLADSSVIDSGSPEYEGLKAEVDALINDLIAFFTPPEHRYGIGNPTLVPKGFCGDSEIDAVSRSFQVGGSRVALKDLAPEAIKASVDEIVTCLLREEITWEAPKGTT